MYIEAVSRARGEVRETQHHLDVAADKGYIASELFEKLDDGYDHSGRMLERLHQSLSKWSGSIRTGKTIKEDREEYHVGSRIGWQEAEAITAKVMAEFD
jgi:hypothetical protein